jgi:hypothetical protein
MYYDIASIAAAKTIKGFKSKGPHGSPEEETCPVEQWKHQSFACGMRYNPATHPILSTSQISLGNFKEVCHTDEAGKDKCSRQIASYYL